MCPTPGCAARPQATGRGARRRAPPARSRARSPRTSRARSRRSRSDPRSRRDPELRHRTSRSRARPRSPEREVDRDRADERPDPEGHLADRVDDNRCDNETGDDRRGVDGVHADRVAAEEAHYGTDDDVEIRDQRSRNGLGELADESSATPSRFSAHTGGRASTLRRSADFDIRRERSIASAEAVPAAARRATSSNRRSSRRGARGPHVSSASSRPAKGGRPGRRASARGRGRPASSRGEAHVQPAPGSSQCSSTWVQRTTSKLASSTGSDSTARAARRRVLDDIDADVLGRGRREERVVRLHAAADVEDANRRIEAVRLPRAASRRAHGG